MNAAILEARLLALAEGKPREQPVIWHYTDDHFLTVIEWVLAGISYKKIIELCGKDLKLPPAKICSVSGLSRFWQEYSPFYLIANRREAMRLSNEVADEAEKTPGRFDQATIDAIKQKAFELAISPVSAPKEVKALMSLLLKSKDQEMKEREFAIQERKMALLEANAEKAKATLGDSKLTPAQREERMREIFGLA